MIDSHTHLNDPRLEPEIESLLARMREAGVTGAIVVGYDVPSSRKAIELARRYPEPLRASVGMHPHDAKDLDAAALDELERLAREPEVVAYGEIGLDFHYDNSPRDVQREAFGRQLEVAKRLGLPVIIHERSASEEALAIIEAHDARKLGGTWHCCSVEPEFAAGITPDFFVGIAGWISFPKADNIRALARAVPLERLLIETDCPYLTPVPYRGKRNEPAYVRLVAESLAEVKRVSVAEVERVTSENVGRAFPGWGR